MSKQQKNVAASFHEHLRRLSRKQCGRDGFDEEIDELRKVDQQVRMNIDEFYTASLGSSTSKNRFSEVRANEGTLVRLSPLSEKDHVSYINANYVDGKGLLGVPFVYIATQAPLPNTVLDFWRMIYENDVGFIIMLCNEIENDKIKSETYWPRVGECLDFGVMWVKSLSETKALDLVYRTFQMRTARGEEREVSHIQYCGWPDQGIPDSSASLMEIIQAMGKSERSVQSPIAVHCSGGIGRTGVFIALHVTLAQFQQEQQDIDVRKTVHILKLCRTGMVQRKDQYVFLYYAAQREMDRMILSAEKGVNLLKMHRERSPQNSIPFDKRGVPPMNPRPTAEGQYAQSPMPYQHLQQQHRHERIHGHSDLGHSAGFSKQELLENYLNRTSLPHRFVVNPLPFRRGNDTDGKNRVPRASGTSPSPNDRKANGAIHDTHRDGGSLEEELQHWQDRTKQMRFSKDRRGRGELHNEQKPHPSQERRQYKSRESRGDGAAIPNARNPRGAKSSGSGGGDNNNASVVHISSPMESLVSDKKQHYPIDEAACKTTLASFPTATSPVSIIVTPQETVTRSEARTENDVRGTDTGTYSSHRNANTELGEKVGNAAEQANVNCGVSSNKNRKVEYMSSSEGVASSSKTGGVREQGSSRPAATVTPSLPESVTNVTKKTEFPLNTPGAHPITEEEFARL